MQEQAIENINLRLISLELDNQILKKRINKLEVKDAEQPKELFTVAQVATMLSCKPSTVRTYIKQGKLMGGHIGANYLIHIESVNKYKQKFKKIN